MMTMIYNTIDSHLDDSSFCVCCFVEDMFDENEVSPRYSG
jgi:hypothetical protein